jgi:L-amino acid N-acyltransferase YncA
MMLEELIYAAYDSGRDRVFIQLVAEKEENAIRVAEMMGFERVATLPGFAKDMAGNDRNLMILELTLEDWRKRLTF